MSTQNSTVEKLVDDVRLLLSSDTNLESLKEIDLCIKQNRVDLENIDLSKIKGLEEALALKTNIADIVDDLVSTLKTVPLSANQGRVLADKITSLQEAMDSVKTVLSSDDTTLDELQEIVNYIKQNKETLETLDLSNIAETNELKHLTKELKEKLENLPSKDELGSFTVPTGFILINPVATIQDGFLECNGATVSREKYSKLFKVIGTSYGAGDGSTTFNLPDLRGEFVRGFDNGRGVDSDRTIGSFQSDAIRNIKGSINSNYISSNPNNENGALKSSIQQTSNRYAYSSGSYWGAKLEFDASKAVPTANENRPRNIAMMYCIKY